MHFTGQDWGSESNLTHFMFRQLSTTEGRWISPDPAGPAAVDITDPQTWNRYVYVANRPLTAVDPAGLKLCAECHFLGLGGGSGGCSADGVDTPCDLVQAMLGQPSFPGDSSNGAAVQCPNNNCSPSYAGGQWLYFGARADGSSGYLPLSLSGGSALDVANARTLVSGAAPKLGHPVDPTSLTGKGRSAYELLLGLGVAPGDITIYQGDGGSFSAVLSAQGFQALMDSGGIQFHSGDAFLHYPYTNGTRDVNATNSLHGVWFDPRITDYVGGSGVYMQFHTDADNPWSGSMWGHMMCALFGAGC